MFDTAPSSQDRIAVNGTACWQCACLASHSPQKLVVRTLGTAGDHTGTLWIQTPSGVLLPSLTQLETSMLENTILKIGGLMQVRRRCRPYALD